MAKAFAWSYSALTGFETCPRQYHQMRILKAFEDPPGEVQLFGLEAHKVIENRILMGRDMPVHLKHLVPIVDKLVSLPGTVRPEYKLALNEQLQPVDFFAKDCWVRAVGDVVNVNEARTRAQLTDWKFGSYREGDGQLKLQAAVTFAAMPTVEEIGVTYVWAKDHKTTVRKFKREDSPAIWQEFLPRVKKMQIAITNLDFPPKPSGLCKKYCRVTTCEFHGKGAY